MDVPFKPGLAPAADFVPAFASLLGEALQGSDWSSFSLGCRWPSAFAEPEKEAARRDFQAGLIRALQALGKEFKPGGAGEIDVLLDFERGLASLQLAPSFVEGRYNKFSRELAQTLHYCYKCKGRGCAFCGKTGRLSKESVEELLASVLAPAFQAPHATFHGAGREDVDVRMLGSGRPFVLELHEPRRRSADLPALEAEINARFPEKIKVSGLAFCAKEKVAAFKTAEHDKAYAAVVECGSAPGLSRLSPHLGLELSVEQRTPIRVSKRRPDLVRNKRVVLQSVRPLAPTTFELVLLASSGLYVKEFISGDEGRSSPSLSSLLGVPCTCKQLDVLAIVEKR